MNYPASPPLVVAYALAGTMDIDLVHEPLGTGSDGQPLYLADICPSPAEAASVVAEAVAAEMFTRDYGRVQGRRPVACAADSVRRHVRVG